MRVRLALPFALAAGVLGIMVTAQMAGATHVRPKAAGVLNGSSVIGYDACTTANRQHGPPIAFPSCNPPVQSSPYVTVGTPDANGAPANSTGLLKMKVQVGTPGPPEDSDIILMGSLTDLRCNTSTACGSANAAAGPDYTGSIQGTATIRISDHWNAIAAGGGPDPATMVDVPFPVDTTCVSTAATTIGSTCTINTSANAVVPQSVKDGKRANIEVGAVQINDGGVDGITATTPNGRFATAGLFVP